MTFFSSNLFNHPIRSQPEGPPHDRPALLDKKRGIDRELTEATEELAGTQENIAALHDEIAQAEKELAAILKPFEGLPLVDRLVLMLNHFSILIEAREARTLTTDLQEEMREEERYLRMLTEEIRRHHHALQDVLAALREPAH